MKNKNLKLVSDNTETFTNIEILKGLLKEIDEVEEKRNK